MPIVKYYTAQVCLSQGFTVLTCDILCQSDNRADILNPGKPRTSSFCSTYLRITEILTYFEMSAAAVERLVEGRNFGCTMVQRKLVRSPMLTSVQIVSVQRFHTRLILVSKRTCIKIHMCMVSFVRMIIEQTLKRYTS